MSEPFATEVKLHTQLYVSLDAVMEQSNSIELSGEGDPRKPYEDMENLLLFFVRELRDLEHHAHDFDEDDRCIYCGLDGRA